MDNMELYNKMREVPKDALKTIQAGRLKGMSDINPMWRIKKLTEIFGMCGFGWKYEITKQWLEQGAGDVVAAFVNINLYIRVNGEWSEPIPGTGGSTFVAMERSGAYTSDEVYKMALTDAISVACKSLGMAADVYYANDRTKYTVNTESQPTPKQSPKPTQDDEDMIELAIQEINGAQSVDTLVQIFNNYKSLQVYPKFMSAMTAKKKEIKIKVNNA